MKTVTIIGFGRFGKVLYRLLKDDFSITIYTRSIADQTSVDAKTITAMTLAEAYTSETIFYAVPIVAFEEMIARHRQYFRDDQVLIDVLSVKQYPKTIFKRYLRGLKTQALATHPMFGPDSIHNGFTGLPIALDGELAESQTITFWKNYFIQKGLRVIEVNADEHDKLMAHSLMIAHFVGRLLTSNIFPSTLLDSPTTQKLHAVCDAVQRDTDELFRGMQLYNPYAPEVKVELLRRLQELGIIPTMPNQDDKILAPRQ